MASTAQINISINAAQATKSVGTLQNDIQATNKELSRLIKTYGENSKQADGMRKSLAGLEIEMSKLGVSSQEVDTNTKSLKSQLRQLQNEIQKLEPGSARFQELSQKAGELKEKITDANVVVGQLAGNLAERLVRGITGVVSIGVAGFQALSAGVALFGGESEELQKTMVRLTALMNLSQAVETFSGLDQKIVEIRASFQSLSVATNVQTVAQQGQNIATVGGVVATTALGTAMKALPLIAIVAAIGTLVYGIYEYVTASGEAAKKDKERKKIKEDLIKAQEEESATLIKSSSGFVLLINQLRATNQGSKERKTLLKEINDKYHTTLENLSSEKKFQAQLNLEVASYIAYQKAKFQLQKNDALVAKELQKQEEIQVKINQQITKRLFYDNEVQRLSKLQDPMGLTEMIEKQTTFNKTISEFRSQITESTQRIANYGKIQLDVSQVIKEIEGNTGRYNEEEKKGGKIIKKNTDLNKKKVEVLNEVSEKLERELAVQQTLDKFRNENVIETLKKEQVAIDKLYGDERQSVIDRALKNEITALEEKFKTEKKSEDEYIVAVKELQKNYDKFLLDSERDLLLQLDIFRKQDLKNVEDQYTSKEKIVLTSTENIRTQTALLEISFEKNERIRQIEAAVGTEEKKQKKIIEIRTEYLSDEIDLLNQSLKQKKDLELLNLNEILNDEKKTNTEKEAAKAQYDQNIITLTQDTADKITGINEGITPPLGDQTDFERGLDEISKYLDAIASAYSDFQNTVSMMSEQRVRNEELRIQGLAEFEKTNLENQLAEGIISREQFDDKVKELDQEQAQQNLQLRRQEFQTNKRLNMANAVINGAQAVLSTFANTPGGVIIKGVAAAIAGIFAATQFGIIASEEFTAAGGGIVPGMGSKNVDSVRSLLAPGETVINQESSQMFPDLLNSINQAGGGISLKPDMPGKNKTKSDNNIFSDNKSQSPIRAYVVETELTDTQKRIDRIKRSAEF